MNTYHASWCSLGSWLGNRDSQCHHSPVARTQGHCADRGTHLEPQCVQGMLQPQTPAAAWVWGSSHAQKRTHVPGYAFCKTEVVGGGKKKKMQLHTFLGLSGTEEPSLKGPRAGGCPAPQLSAQILSITRATAGTGAVGSSSPGGPGRQGRGSGSLSPSLGDLWGKVVDRKPLRPGNRQHPTAADAEHCASEHSCGVQVGAAAQSRSYR